MNEANTNYVEFLVQQIEGDIRFRGLRPGDRYEPDEKVDRLMSINTVMAEQAINQLADRGIVSQVPDSGTFVAEAVYSVTKVATHNLRLIVNADIGEDPDAVINFFSSDLLDGMKSSIHDVSVQVDIVTGPAGMEFARNLVNEAYGTPKSNEDSPDLEFLNSDSEAEKSKNIPDIVGVVLIRAPMEMQWFFENSGLPTVTYGSLHPGVTGIGCLDANQRQVGTEVAKYVVRHKHQNVLLMMYSYWAPGDNAFLSGMIQEFHATPKNEPMLEVISVEPAQNVMNSIMRQAMAAAAPPTIIVARNSTQTKLVYNSIKKLGLKVPEDIELINAHYVDFEIDGKKIPSATISEDIFECGRILSQMVVAISKGKDPTTMHRLLPVTYDD